VSFAHVTVLRDEAVQLLAPRAGGVYADVTLGGGGHAELILEKSGPDGVLLGIDRDPAALEAAKARLERFGARARLVHADFASLSRVLEEENLGLLDGLVADVGVSSPQIDTAERGFSFQAEGPLDMRMDPTRGETARELIARLDADALADLIYELGEERKSRRIARAIKEAERDTGLATTADLRAAIHRVMPRRGRIDPATRTFQALRIAVNGELDQLESLMDQLADVLADEGVAAIISFHSLEDRIVKWSFREDPALRPIHKKPIVAGDEETGANPRARTAKLRGARRLPRGAA